MVNWLTKDENESSEQLPWAKDWVKTVADGDTRIRELISCILGDKGLLLQTGEFKGFLFKGTGDYKIVVEALNYVVEQKVQSFPMVIEVKRSGKIAVGIDDTLPAVLWDRDENKITSRRVDDTPVLSAKPNPLLDSMLITPPDSRADADTRPNTAPNHPGKAPTKGKRLDEVAYR